jgi:hypothetical protein
MSPSICAISSGPVPVSCALDCRVRELVNVDCAGRSPRHPLGEVLVIVGMAFAHVGTREHHLGSHGPGVEDLLSRHLSGTTRTVPLLALMHRAGCMTFQSWSVRSARRRTGLPLAPTMTSPRIPELRSTPRRPASPRPCAGSPIPRRRARRDRFVGGHYADSRRRHASFADELRHHAVDDDRCGRRQQ